MLRICRSYSDLVIQEQGWQKWFNPSSFAKASSVYEGALRTRTQIQRDSQALTPNYWSNFQNMGLDNAASWVLQQPFWWGQSACSVTFARTTVNQAIIACALQRYQTRRGNYPAELAQLVPEFLQKVPFDTVRGRPFYYRSKGESNFDLRGSGVNLLIESSGRASDDWIWSYPPAQAELPK